jgi:AraC-like DNA-binding protein
MNYDKLHIKAMNIVEAAILDKKAGNEKSALNKMIESLDYEMQAAYAARKDRIGAITVSILFKSAAAIALDIKKYENALHLCNEGMKEKPPAPISDELLEIQHKARQISFKNYREHEENVQRMLEKIKMNTSTSLGDLAKEFNLSRKFISRLFIKYTGKSIVRYILECRIEKAKILLEQSTFSMKEIAEQIGFKRVSSFKRTLKNQDVNLSKFRNEQDFKAGRRAG